MPIFIYAGFLKLCTLKASKKLGKQNSKKISKFQNNEYCLSSILNSSVGQEVVAILVVCYCNL